MLKDKMKTSGIATNQGMQETFPSLIDNQCKEIVVPRKCMSNPASRFDCDAPDSRTVKRRGQNKLRSCIANCA